MSKTDVINKFKTLSQGSISESVLDKMGSTFVHLCGLADFSGPAQSNPAFLKGEDESIASDDAGAISAIAPNTIPPRQLGGLHYNIQIIMPESRDPKVYDALFRSLKEHLFS